MNNTKSNLPFVLPEELIISRSPFELHDWVEKKFEEIAGKPGGKDAIRFHRGLCKQLVEEVYPLSIFGNHKYGNSSTVKLEPVLGNQNYDALVEDLASSERFKLEITQAHEGENEYLRMLLLQRDGHVWPYGKVKKSGTKNTGISVSIEPSVAMSYEEHVNRVIVLLEDAIKRKSGGQYDCDTSLLVMYEDSIIFRDNNITEILNEFISNIVVPLDLTFKEIFIAGWSKESFHAFLIN